MRFKTFIHQLCNLKRGLQKNPIDELLGQYNGCQRNIYMHTFHLVLNEKYIPSIHFIINRQLETTQFFMLGNVNKRQNRRRKMYTLRDRELIREINTTQRGGRKIVEP